MHPSLLSLAHRPWPQPRQPWIIAQNWRDLLFAHWAVPAQALRRLLPATLELDLFNQQAWIGIVPFVMTNVRLRGTPAIPSFSTFPELNVRTYVTANGKPGVWFFSLDAANRIAVELARLSFHLPYFHGRMQAKSGSAGIIYSSRRTDRRGGDEQLEVTYGASGPSFEAKHGTLEYFLTERYCLYAQRSDGELLRGEIHHPPWKLQHAQASFALNTMTKNLAIDTATSPSILHFSKLQQMIGWPPSKLRV